MLKLSTDFNINDILLRDLFKLTYEIFLYIVKHYFTSL